LRPSFLRLAPSLLVHPSIVRAPRSRYTPLPEAPPLTSFSSSSGIRTMSRAVAASSLGARWCSFVRSYHQRHFAKPSTTPFYHWYISVGFVGYLIHHSSTPFPSRSICFCVCVALVLSAHKPSSPLLVQPTVGATSRTASTASTTKLPSRATRTPISSSLARCDPSLHHPSLALPRPCGNNTFSHHLSSSRGSLLCIDRISPHSRTLTHSHVCRRYLIIEPLLSSWLLRNLM